MNFSRIGDQLYFSKYMTSRCWTRIIYRSNSNFKTSHEEFSYFYKIRPSRQYSDNEAVIATSINRQFHYLIYTDLHHAQTDSFLGSSMSGIVDHYF